MVPEPRGPARLPWTRRTGSTHGDTLLLAFVAWLCSLPALLLVAVPLLGWRAGGLLALVWLAGVAAACFAVCVRRVSRPGSARRGAA